MGETVGIDIHKAELLVAIGGERPFRIDRTPARLRWLARRLHTRRVALIVLEPSGGYERVVLDVLLAYGLPVARVNPREVRWYARGAGIAAKSDPLDARVLARYGLLHGATLYRLTAPSPGQRRLAELSALRRTLRDDVTAKRHQLAEQSAAVQAVYQRLIATLQTELAQIEAELAALLATLPGMARRQEILCSCPGIGPTTATLLLAELPELGQRTAKEIARLVGVAPLTQQSGTSQDAGHIEGGRRHVRAGLWLTTLTAMRYNPTIRTFAARLQATGKPAKVVRIACQHKLLTILNALVMKDELWQAPAVTA